jgi:hypothetical protein
MAPKPFAVAKSARNFLYHLATCKYAGAVEVQQAAWFLGVRRFRLIATFPKIFSSYPECPHIHREETVFG